MQTELDTPYDFKGENTNFQVFDQTFQFLPGLGTICLFCLTCSALVSNYSSGLP